jgi:glutamate/tyrosine decarboxylase-like PLP-dependent enzyme
MLTYSLSITTFRYVGAKSRDEKYLNELNAAILEKLQKDGSVYPSNAVIGGRFAIRACIVNFRTQSADVRALVEATVAAGRALDSST